MIPNRKILRRMGYLRDQEGILNQYGNITSRPLIYAGLPERIREENWSWDFDALGACRPGTRTKMEVHAVEWR